ncbi:hypothetical protein BDV96DRAFT_639255 [Lophiotrema nucula]|uniref:Heterokaryon incompatibility domain-containing protein n=1 Tax=Lophiotrema nucula TaxID=690887 RepID=A0A6A5ZUX8_9PLEO|nr:hypothetical protein BDV96DRAFT_639255 [Lophiotrema nucula]
MPTLSDPGHEKPSLEDDQPTTVAHAMFLAGRTKGLNLFDPTPLSHLPDGKLPLELPDEEIEEGLQRINSLHREIDESDALVQTILDDIGLSSPLAELTENDAPNDAVPKEVVQDMDVDQKGQSNEYTQHFDEDDDDLGDWPRRLLHVPSMTSFKWQPGNVYDGARSPDFAVLSYTWGRWKLEDGQEPGTRALDVKGVTWPIPRVGPELFTIEQFQRAIEGCISARKPRVVLEYLWLDVACISQNGNDPEGDLEIGRQAKIFGRAREKFEWLASNSAIQIPGTSSKIYPFFNMLRQLHANF